jgi:DNA-binding MarR family transcriptional regulator
MLSNTTIIINNQKYKAQIGSIARNGLNIGYNLNLFKGSEFVGSVDIFVAAGLSKSWAGHWENSEENKNWLIDLLIVTLPHINIVCDEAQIKKDNHFSFSITFTSDPDQIDENKIYIKAEWDVQRQVEKLVYDDDVEDEKVELNALDYLEECIKEEAQPILVNDLIKALYIDPKIAERALGTLYNNGYVGINEYTGTIATGKIIIHTKGQNKLRDMKRQAANSSGTIYNIGGDFVQGSKNVNITYGQGSHIIQNSHDIQIINENIDKLLQQLETDYKEDDKSEVIKKVNSLKDMVEKSSQVADIVDKAIELLPKIKKYASAAIILLKLLGHFYVTPVS